MNISYRKRFFAGCGLVFCVCSALADSADTIALYSFSEGIDGTSAVGTSITNSVDNAKYSGAPTTVDTATVRGGVAFSSDRPAKYIFSGQGGTPIMIDPQSLSFTGRMDGNYTQERAGGDVAFSDLGSDMSGLDEYTVEFFFKIDTNELVGVNEYYKNRFSRSVKWESGAWFGFNDYEGNPVQCASGFDLLNNVREILYCSSPEKDPKGNYNSVYVNWNNGSVNMNNEPEWSAAPNRNLSDGLWHHISVIHDKVGHRSRVCLDYGLYDNKAWRQGTWKDEWIVESNTTLNVSAPFNLGCYVYRGKIACLRVSKKMLDVSEMMYASELESYKPTETLFHWRFEGASGDAVTMVSNSAPTFRSVNTNLCFLNSQSIVPAAMSGNGTVVSDGFAKPVFTNDVHLMGRGQLFDGAALIADTNRSSVYFHPTEYKMKPVEPVDYWRTGAPGVVIPKTAYDFDRISGHDFTMEMYFRFDAGRWLAEEKSTSPRMTLFGAKNDSYNFDWALSYGTVSTEKIRVDLSFWYKDPSTMAMTPVSVTKSVPVGENPYDAKWHHYAVTYDAAEKTFDLYLDGELFLTKTLPAFAFNGKGQLNVGQGLNNETACGAFDEVRLTARKLAPSEFLTLKKRPLGLMVILR